MAQQVSRTDKVIAPEDIAEYTVITPEDIGNAEWATAYGRWREICQAGSEAGATSADEEPRTGPVDVAAANEPDAYEVDSADMAGLADLDLEPGA